MSSELKMILNTVALKESELRGIDFDKGMDRYKYLLKKLVKEKTIDVLYTVEGAVVPDLDMTREDLKVLEKANLVKGQTKYTHHNEYRQYELTEEGAKLAEKLLNET